MQIEPKASQIKSERVRPAGQAGRFYPADREELRSMLEKLMQPADAELRGMLPDVERTKTGQELIGILAPHAGYTYSGAVAGAAFAEIRSERFDHVLILAPSHYGDFHGFALPNSGSFETPLGRIPLDIPAMRELLNGDLFMMDEPAHDPEHAIEVQLPFLQIALAQSFQILPLLLARLQDEELLKIAERLTAFLNQRKQAGEHWLIVASSDTYHGYNVDDCVENDQKFLALLKKASCIELLSAVRRQELMACGWAAVALTMEIMQRNGPIQCIPLARNDSSQGREGMGGYVVGYVSAIFFSQVT
jgi:MEMO1 family protein